MGSAIPRRDIILKLKKFGFQGPISGGKHQFMKKEEIKARIPNPHKTKEIHISLIKEILKQAGINEDEFSSCLSSGKMADEVNSDLADGSSYGVTGTPAFFINGELLEGAQPFSAFKQAIDNALAGSNEVNSGNTVQL